MHVRFSTVIGFSVYEEHTETPCALLHDILIHPDTGKIEGFFVKIPGFLQSEERFLQTMDIVHWGKQVRISHIDRLIPVTDVIRFEQLLDEHRPVMGQHIISEGGLSIGMCRDVQFDTKLFMLEWLFPRKWLRWKRAIPVSSIVQVRTDAVVVRDAVLLPDADENVSFLPGADLVGG